MYHFRLKFVASTKDLINILTLLFTPNDFTIIPRLILVPGRMHFEFDSYHFIA